MISLVISKDMQCRWWLEANVFGSFVFLNFCYFCCFASFFLVCSAVVLSCVVLGFWLLIVMSEWWYCLSTITHDDNDGWVVCLNANVQNRQCMCWKCNLILANACTECSNLSVFFHHYFSHLFIAWFARFRSPCPFQILAFILRFNFIIPIFNRSFLTFAWLFVYLFSCLCQFLFYFVFAFVFVGLLPGSRVAVYVL